MNDPFQKTPAELWAFLLEEGRGNATVRRVLDCKRFNGLTPEHAALGLAVALLEQNKELGKHVLTFFEGTPLHAFMLPQDPPESLRASEPKVDPNACPDCGRGHIYQIGTSGWWECDHCIWRGRVGPAK